MGQHGKHTIALTVPQGLQRIIAAVMDAIGAMMRAYRKDYRAFAEMLHDYRENYALKGYTEELGAVDLIVDSMCQIFARDNSRFDSERFLTAVREGLGCKK